MTDIKRLGLGCMGMNLSNQERSIETVRYALDHGVTLLNTGEFYGGGKSDMVKKTLEAAPLKRHGYEGELNGAMLYFASDASSYCTGQILYVDGGLTSQV